MSENVKKKVNPMDILLVLAILAVVAYAAYSLVIAPALKRESVREIEFVIEMQTTTLDIAMAIKEDDVVTVMGKPSARIKNVEIVPAKKVALNSTTGMYHIQVVPERWDVFTTVVANATETDEELNVFGTPVRIGGSIAVEGQGYSANGVVLDLRFTNESESEVAQ